MIETKQLTDGSSVETVAVKKPRSEETRLVQRDTKTGMFAAKPKKKALTPIEVQNATLRKLTDAMNGEPSLWEQIIENLAKNATMSPEQPVFDKLGNIIMVDGKPLTVKDAKIAMAAAKNFDSLLK